MRSQLLTTLLCLPVAVPLGAQEPQPVGASRRTQAHFRALDSVPFVPNQGQWADESVLYHARFGTNLEVVIDESGWRQALIGEAAVRGAWRAPDSTAAPAVGALLRFTVSGRPLSPPEAGPRLDGVFNYFLGNDAARWKTHVPLFESISLRAPDAVIRLTESEGLLAYEIEGDASAVSELVFRVDGASGLERHFSGGLVLETPIGDVVLALAPSAGTQWVCVPVSANSFKLAPVPGGVARLGSVTVAISTLFGGGDIDEVHDMYAVGNTYSMCGITAETLVGFQPFPTTPGALQPTHIPMTNAASGLNNFPATHPFGRAMDGFVTQVLVRPTNDPPPPAPLMNQPSIRRDGTSSQPILPDPQSNDLVATLEFSTFLGSNANDYLESIHVLSGGITVGGYIEHDFTAGIPNTYPLTADALPIAFHDTIGDNNALWGVIAFREGILTQLLPSQTGASQLVYSTYYGGTYHDDIRDVVGHDSGTITFSGMTSSPGLPGMGAYSFDSVLSNDDNPDLMPNQPQQQHVRSNEWDGFIARIQRSSPTTTYVAWATYLGGSNPTPVPGEIATEELLLGLNITGNRITVVGRTNATDFPVTAPTIQASNQGEWDAFVTQFGLGPNAMNLRFSTYLGGELYDIAEDVDVDPTTGLIYVVGNAESGHRKRVPLFGVVPAIPFPTTPGAYDTMLNDWETAVDEYEGSCADDFVPYLDGFVSIIDPTPGAPVLVASTFYGTSNMDIATAIDYFPSGPNVAARIGITGWSHVGGGGPTVWHRDSHMCDWRSDADAFVAVFNASLTTLMHEARFGGEQDDLPRAIVLRGPNLLFDEVTAVLGGYTYSNAACPPNLDLNGWPFSSCGVAFPTTAGAYSTAYTNEANARAMHWLVFGNSYSPAQNTSNSEWNLGEPFLSVLKLGP